MALAGGQQLQRHPGLRSELLPRFARRFLYPEGRKKHSWSAPALGTALSLRGGGAIPVLHLTGELLEDLSRTSVVF